MNTETKLSAGGHRFCEQRQCILLYASPSAPETSRRLYNSRSHAEVNQHSILRRLSQVPQTTLTIDPLLPAAYIPCRTASHVPLIDSGRDSTVDAGEESMFAWRGLGRFLFGA